MNDTTDTTYFDSITQVGVCYLNRARNVQSRNGSYLAVQVSALEGPAGNVEYIRTDTIVKGSEAIERITTLIDQINDENVKVLAGVNLGSVRPASFEGESGTVLTLKGALLKVRWAKIDGQHQFPIEPEQASQEEVSDEPSAADLCSV